MFKLRYLILAGAAAAAFFYFNSSQGSVDGTSLRITDVKKGRIERALKLRGKVELDRKEKISSQLPATISAISVREGDIVTAGASLAFLDTIELSLALKRAEAAYDSASASSMDVKNIVKTEQLKQAEAQLEQAAIARKSAATDFEYKKDRFRKTESLTARGSASEQDKKDARTLLDAAENFLAESEKRVKIAEYNLTLLRKGSSEYLIKASEQNAEQARISIESIKNDIQKAVVKTVIGGVVLVRYHDAGAFVQPGTPLFDIGDMSTAYIRAEVLVDDMSKVREGQKVILTGDAIDNKKYTGEVYFIAPRAFTKISSLGVEQQKIDVRIKYDVKALALRQGYELDSNIVTTEKSGALMVAYKAVFESEGKNRIFVIKNGTLELREVATGIENDENIEIISGAAEGEKAVIDPPNNLKPGMKIKL